MRPQCPGPAAGSTQVRRLASRAGRWDELKIPGPPIAASYCGMQIGDADGCAWPEGELIDLGTLGLRAKNRSGQARDGYCGWGIFTTPKPVAEPCRPGNRGLRLLDRHARSKVAPAVCTRHAFTDVDYRCGTAVSP